MISLPFFVIIIADDIYIARYLTINRSLIEDNFFFHFEFLLYVRIDYIRQNWNAS